MYLRLGRESQGTVPSLQLKPATRRRTIVGKTDRRPARSSGANCWSRLNPGQAEARNSLLIAINNEKRIQQIFLVVQQGYIPGQSVPPRFECLPFPITQPCLDHPATRFFHNDL